MPARKAARKDTPPGDIMLEIRVARRGEQSRMVLSQPVHDYTIEQSDDAIHIHGVVRKPE